MSLHSDTALVLLHGFCEDNSLWDEIIPKLNFEGEIIAPDLPGFGHSTLKPTEFTLEDIATTLYEELKASAVKKCICIGHSLGGYITLALKHKFPSFVLSIGLLHSTSFMDTEEKKEIRNKLVKFLDHNPPSSFLSTFAPSLFSKPNRMRLKPEISKVISMSEGVTGKTIQAYAKAIRDREEYSSLLYNEKEPLFIGGENDQAVPKSDSIKQISMIKNQDNCYLLKNVAHMGIYESPSDIIDAINKHTSNNLLANR